MKGIEVTFSGKEDTSNKNILLSLIKFRKELDKMGYHVLRSTSKTSIRFLILGYKDFPDFDEDIETVYQESGIKGFLPTITKKEYDECINA